MSTVVIESIDCEPLSVPLVDPFVIASGRVDTTRSVLVTVRIRENGLTATGLGEAACLPPVTSEDQGDVLSSVSAARAALERATFDASAPKWASLHTLLDGCFSFVPVARSGVEMAILDALARARGVPLFQLLSGGEQQSAPVIETDITLPILAPSRMSALASEWWGKGFRAFKVKVGRALDVDLAALDAIRGAVPRGAIRADANGGYDANTAVDFVRACERMSVTLECFEQPCPTDDVNGLAHVAGATSVPVIADESVKRVEDLTPLRALRAAHGVNLKVAKCGGLLRAYDVGRAARQSGMVLMVGGMVETRLGMSAATHLAAALGGVEFPDLDTAWLLAEDRFRGGYREEGPRYTLTATPGLGVEKR